MKYVKLFEQFVNEVIDLNSAYQYKTNKIERSGDGHLDGIFYSFTTQSGTKYQASLEKLPRKSSDTREYDFNFAVKGGWFDDMTEEHDAIRVMATIARMLKSTIEKYELYPIPISIKGIPDPSKPDMDLESARDRIYKHLAKREFGNVRPGNPFISGYRFVDMGEDGFALEPINDDENEQLDESIDLKRGYAFEPVNVWKNSDGKINFLQYAFKTRDNALYNVEFKHERYHDNYDFGFSVRGENDTFVHLTNQGDATAVFATITNILLTIVRDYKNELYAVPIHIKGSPKPTNPNGWFEETSRDRIYKHIAARNLHHVPGYEYKDLGAKGFDLVPIENKTEQLDEAIDLRSAYSFRVATYKNFNDKTIDFITYGFKTDKGTKYHVSLTLNEEMDDNYEYEFYFNLERSMKTSDYQTEEHDAIRVFATVTAILKHIIETVALKPVPIRIKGSNKPGERQIAGNSKIENTRDRIYKSLAQREIDKIRRIGTPGVNGYRFSDLGKEGLILTPIYQQQRRLRSLHKENEAITMFNDKTEKVL